jgi:DNA-directed RNA polymerase subunit M/transcription elongation factor TFIIS
MKEALKLALEELAVRFSEGWHEGIKIDASDIMLLNEAAQALAQPAQEPTCPSCGNNRQVWTNQITGRKTCHRVGCDHVQPAQEPVAQEPRNFCPRCGKRTADLTVIHTCTPPRGLEMT